MYDDGLSVIDPQHVQGEMTVGPNLRNKATLGEPDFNTLDEPIKDTIVRYIHLLHSLTHSLTHSLHIRLSNTLPLCKQCFIYSLEMSEQLEGNFITFYTLRRKKVYLKNVKNLRLLISVLFLFTPKRIVFKYVFF
jgi:hypothetical protein